MSRYVLDQFGGFGAIWILKRSDVEKTKSISIFEASVDRHRP